MTPTPAETGPRPGPDTASADFSDLRAMFFNCTLKREGGFPVGGNLRTAWEAGARFDYANPEYR